jgi:hypothetical protein
VLARVERRRAKLTPAGDWVQTDVTATIIETFKAPEDPRFRPKASFTFTEEGGEFQVGGVKIKAIVPYARQLESGRIYLMLVGVDPENSRLVLGSSGIWELRAPIKIT